MDYLFENLGDEKFQEFCHTIITKEFPNSQAFPVGQPDGGRDSIVYLNKDRKKEFIVFQVKYVKNPNKDEPHKWLNEIIKKEAKKINKLIPKGAKGFYLMTNVRGTAHFEVGSIDKINKILEEEISIPAICWWRDDISRKIENNIEIKWSYPEILSGQDILNKIVFENISENRERRENVIKAYLRDQYEIDNEVKFKQIELQNKLLELYTDVPLDVKKIDESNKKLIQTLITNGFDFELSPKYFNNFSNEEKKEVGAAQFLLNLGSQAGINRVLIEGGPGQGKSTISQFVCQIHRIRLLSKVDDFNLVPEYFLNTKIRLPFKIDLRDIASWIENRNPYSSSIGDIVFNANWQNSLESFLVFHLMYHSGQTEFNTNDLIAVLKLSSVLIVFDGFDEVANLDTRQAIITFINKGLSRLSENSSSIQVIITSRPAAFSGSIGFSVDVYPHFELTDINHVVINEYVEKWILARRLDVRTANEIRDLVHEKLKVPHLKDLAKSPMQLAILISLLNTRGQSLPNKRTALYESYIELFFNRESEKSVQIRDNRELIIEIHEYLAWILHSEAELYRNSGRIEIASLHEKLNNYLISEGHTNIIAQDIFKVMEERVCALVSRVQGTFEFEVQPLREFFAAKFLYKTSPHSSAGQHFTGTKPDRFEAISKNQYWQNVCRFYAGCFDKGELPMLIDKLKELQEDQYLKYTNYPRLLTSQLLSDYVFKQYPRLLGEVMSLILSGLKLGKIMNQNDSIGNNESITIPIECGRLELVMECFNQLKVMPSEDFADELISLINNNPHNKFQLWSESLPNYTGKELTLWLKYGSDLEVLSKLDNKLVNKILQESDTELLTRIGIFIKDKIEKIINDEILFKREALQGVLNGKFYYIPRDKKIKSIGILSLFFHRHFISFPFVEKIEKDIPYRKMYDELFFRDFDSSKQKSFFDFDAKDDIDNNIKNFFNSINTILDSPISSWSNNIQNWEILEASIKKHFGECMIMNVISTLSAKLSVSVTPNHDDFYNNEVSLCKRVRFARLKSGNIYYWKEQLSQSKNKNLSLLVFIAWSTPKTLISLGQIASEEINKLSAEDYNKLEISLDKLSGISMFHAIQKTYLEKNINSDLSGDYAYLFIYRLPFDDMIEFLYRHIKNVTHSLHNFHYCRLVYLMKSFFIMPENKDLLDEIKIEYLKFNINYDINRATHLLNQFSTDKEIPVEVAQLILSNEKLYPKIMVIIAENIYWRYAISKIEKVGVIAQRDSWFD